MTVRDDIRFPTAATANYAASGYRRLKAFSKIPIGPAPTSKRRVRMFSIVIAGALLNACQGDLQAPDSGEEGSRAATTVAQETPAPTASATHRQAEIMTADETPAQSGSICPALAMLAESCDPLAGEKCYVPTDCLDATDDRAREALTFLQPTEVFRGRPTAPDKHLETVLITKEGERAHLSDLCSGVLLSRKVVITAAHCVTAGVAVERANVTVGVSFPLNRFQTSISKVESAFEATGSDMALLLLENAVPLTIRPARIAGSGDLATVPVPSGILAQDGDVAKAVGARIVGFGRTETGELGVKKQTDVGVVSRRCNATKKIPTGETLSDETLFECRAGRELVAGAVRGRPGVYSDTCGGDSGGPLFVAAAAKAGRADYYTSIETDYYLAAITKKAVDTRYVPAGPWPMCGNGGIYTLLSDANLLWIRATMQGWGEQPLVRP